jgi:hypothetical protein
MSTGRPAVAPRATSRSASRSASLSDACGWRRRCAAAVVSLSVLIWARGRAGLGRTGGSGRIAAGSRRPAPPPRPATSQQSTHLHLLPQRQLLLGLQQLGLQRRHAAAGACQRLVALGLPGGRRHDGRLADPAPAAAHRPAPGRAAQLRLRLLLLPPLLLLLLCCRACRGPQGGSGWDSSAWQAAAGGQLEGKQPWQPAAAAAPRPPRPSSLGHPTHPPTCRPAAACKQRL